MHHILELKKVPRVRLFADESGKLIAVIKRTGILILLFNYMRECQVGKSAGRVATRPQRL